MLVASVQVITGGVAVVAVQEDDQREGSVSETLRPLDLGPKIDVAVGRDERLG